MPQRMTMKTLRKALIDADLTGADIARTLGLSRQSVSLVICGGSENPRVRRAIAAALKLTYSRVWGEPDPGVDRVVAGRKRRTHRTRKCVDTSSHSDPIPPPASNGQHLESP